jgi:hypothetical protein
MGKSFFGFVVSAALLLAVPSSSLTGQLFDDKTLILQPVQYDLDLLPDFETGRLDGDVVISFVNAGGEPTSELPMVLYRMMSINRLEDGNGRAIPFTQNVVMHDGSDRLQLNYIDAELPHTLLPGDTATVRISYGGQLRGYTETGMLYVQDRIDPEFSIIRNDAWAFPLIQYPSRQANGSLPIQPSFHYHAEITVPDSLTVAALGRLVSRETVQGKTTFVYESQKSAWRMDFAIAPYEILAEDGHQVFFFQEDRAGAERVMEGLTRCLALYTRWFGELRGDPRFNVIEIPPRWGSQADVTGILQTADAFRDSDRSAALYHEISHLWNPTDTDPQSPRWNEGLAMFLQNLAAEELNGDPTREEKMARTVGTTLSRLDQNPETARVPLIEWGPAGLARRSYTAGAIAFDVLFRVLGQEEFNAIIGGFYHQFAETGATTQAFIDYANEATDGRLEEYFQNWFLTADWYDQLKSGLTTEEMAESYR